MKSKLFLILLLLISVSAFAVPGDPKSRYDISEQSLGKGTDVPFLGWKMKLQNSEITVLPGLYFTWGTVAGKSSSALDDRMAILFGHPYAKTSYPVLLVDGLWKRPEEVFPKDSLSVHRIGDSVLTVKTFGTPLYALETSYGLTNNGNILQCTIRMINKDSTPHLLALGHIIDPALGNRGDAVIAVNDRTIFLDTTVTTSSVITMSERSGSLFGMSIGIDYSNEFPSSILIKNWREGETDKPSFDPGPVRRLYDVVIKSFWSPVNVPAHDTLTRTFSMTLLDPNFGTSVFTRWDVPRFLSIEDGIMHPSILTTTASAINTSALSKNITLRLLNNNYVATTVTQKDTSLSSLQTGYIRFPLTIKEAYENIVADFELTTSVNGIAVDTLLIPVFIPSTPVSDTGLTVTIDSLIVAAKPKISAIFEVTRNSTQQKFFSLNPENVFLYENDSRIRDFSLRKDTTGGVDALDLVFVLDVTGSMGGTINGVKNNIIEFTDSLKAQGIDFRLGMVTFLDEIENVYDFVNDPQIFKGYVALQYAHGGGDGPENSLDALYRASQFTFRNNANRVFIWITDISYHESDWATTRTKAQVINALLQNDITVHAVGPQSYQTVWYNPIIEPTGGSYYNISGNFRDIMLNISRMKTTSKFLLSYQSPLSGTGQRSVKLEVHVAGLGGSAVAIYQNPAISEMIEPLACYPNPFNPQTTIRVSLPVEGTAAITIYNMLGQRARRFEINANQGTAGVVWDATDDFGRPVSSGLYIIRAEVLSRNGVSLNAQTTKVIYLK